MTSVPLVAYHFHLVTPVALLVNPLIAIPTSAALFSGFAVLLMGSWLPPAAALLGFGCHRSLRICDWIIQTAAPLPGGHWWVPAPPT